MHSVYSRNKTNNAFKEEEVTAHFQGRHDVFIHCFHHFLQTTVRTHWLILGRANFGGVDVVTLLGPSVVC